MYSAVAERSREIATIRALGFGAGAVVLSFVIEALLVALAGGLVGCLAALPLNGLTTPTMNFQTFSHLAFAFRVTPAVLGLGIVFALLMGSSAACRRPSAPRGCRWRWRCGTCRPLVRGHRSRGRLREAEGRAGPVAPCSARTPGSCGSIFAHRSQYFWSWVRNQLTCCWTCGISRTTFAYWSTKALAWRRSLVGEPAPRDPIAHVRRIGGAPDFPWPRPAPPARRKGRRPGSSTTGRPRRSAPRGRGPRRTCPRPGSGAPGRCPRWRTRRSHPARPGGRRSISSCAACSCAHRALERFRGGTAAGPTGRPPGCAPPREVAARVGGG